MSNAPTPKRRYAGKAARERHAERYCKLIEAGVEVIGRHGYQSTSIKAVCQEAGLTERYFYQCFKDRESLLAAVYEHLNEQLRDRTLAALAQVSQDPSAMARAGAEVYFQMLRDDPRAARILLFEGIGASSTLLRLNRAAEAHYVELIRAAIRRSGRSSHLSPERAKLVAAGMVGAGVNIGQRWVMDDYRQPLEDVVESMLTISDAVSAHLAKKAGTKDLR